MTVKIYTSRDLRSGKPLDVVKDGYKYEVPDILLEVDVVRVWDDWEITARVAEDVQNMSAKGVDAPGLLFHKGQLIDLDDKEEEEAIEEYCRTERGVCY